MLETNDWILFLFNRNSLQTLAKQIIPESWTGIDIKWNLSTKTSSSKPSSTRSSSFKKQKIRKNYTKSNHNSTLLRPVRFPGIAGNAGNHRKDGKFHKSDHIINQTKRSINKLCLGKISLQKTLRIKFSVDSGFSNELYGKKRKPVNTGNQQKAF